MRRVSEKEDGICESYLSGLSMRKVAERFDVGKSTVSAVLKRKRIPTRKDGGVRVRGIRRSSMEQKFHEYKSNAKRRKIEWALTYEDAHTIFNKPCRYCGIPGPSGIDRIDSSYGYTPDNVTSACWPCNCAKAEMTVDEFLTHIHRIAKFTKMPD